MGAVVAVLGVVSTSPTAGASDSEEGPLSTVAVTGQVQFHTTLTSPVTAVGAAADAVGATTRVNVATGGTQASNFSDGGVVSSNGRYVAFASAAATLVSGDTNDVVDVFVRDRTTGSTTRVSVAADGRQTNFGSGGPAISADGRYVAFSSEATHLVSGDTNGVGDVFVRDRTTGATTRVSVGTGGSQTNSDSGEAAISADGRYVAFSSQASNLVPGDTNGDLDRFVHDRDTGTTTRVNVATDGTQSLGDDHAGDSHPAISGDGRYIVFSSAAANLVGGDTNNTRDVLVRDQVTGTTTRVNVATDGSQANLLSDTPSISFDGRYIAFASMADNLVAGDTNGAADVFLHDSTTGATTRVSVATDGAEGTSGSGGPAISADGRYVAFTSSATDLVAGDTNESADVFVHDRVAGTTVRVNVATDGAQASGSGGLGSISGDGRYVVFGSNATNLVPGDTNDNPDVFVRDRFAPTTAFGDFTMDGWSDLIARQASSGSLYLYPGAGNAFAARISIGTGWTGINAITRLGDFNRDGREDLIAVKGDTGSLWLYPGSGAGSFTTAVKLGSRGWNGMREITAVGDLTGDGYPDLLAVQTTTGYLYLYPGRGSSLGTRRQIGTGWTAMGELAGIGDFNHDGQVDLIARRNSTGALWLYPGSTGGSLGPRVRVGTSGWDAMRALVGVGDFNRDGNTDLIAVHTATGNLYLYPGAGSSFAPRQIIGRGWSSSYTPLL